ncbi:MAG: hypothetical protein ACT4PU_01935 [Planctomycetota bacterium]
MAQHWKSVAGTSLLLLGLLILAAAVLPLLGGAVLIPHAGLFVWVVALLAVFLGVQLLVFRALNLRSRADELNAAQEAGELDEDNDPAL